MSDTGELREVKPRAPQVDDLFVGKTHNGVYYYDLVKGNDSSV